MRSLLLNICLPAIWAIVICETVIAVLLFKRCQKTKQPLSLLTLLVSAGLIYPVPRLKQSKMVKQPTKI